MNKKDLAGMRRDYSPQPLDSENMLSDPFSQFGEWFSHEESFINRDGDLSYEANAMVLSTATPSGMPSSRVVLLKSYSPEGFLFFTNYESKKGIEIAQNNRVALLFFWQKSMRQVRIEGVAQKISEEDSDKYFKTRPRESQASSSLSQQSRPLSDKAQFDKIIKNLAESNSEIIRPANWGGYIVIPQYFEFWQGGSGRSHDRIIFKRASTSGDTLWEIYRIYP